MEESEKMSKSETLNLIRCILLSVEESPYILSEFLHDFEREAGYPLPCYEHNTAVDFLKSIPEVIQVVNIKDYLYVQIGESNDSEHLDVSDSKEEELSNDDASPPRAPFADGIPEEGKSKKKKKKKVKVKGRKDKRINIKTQRPSKSEDKEIQKKKKVVISEECNSGKEIANEIGVDCARCALLKAEEDCISLLDMRLSQLAIDEKDIPLINLNEYVKLDKYIEITVAEVCSPHNFIIHLTEFRAELTKLMGRMLTFYNLYHYEYAIENIDFVSSNVCAALYKTNSEFREWYRAKIIYYGAHSSKVLLLDYGITTEISNTNLKLLDRAFAQLPVQGLLGRLANIKPYRRKYWSEDCCRRLFDFVFEKDLLAQVISMDCKKMCLTVMLWYKDENFNVNKALIKDHFPDGDCDFSEEGFVARRVYESTNPKKFIRPEDMGRIQRLRSEFLNFEDRKVIRVSYQHRNKELKKYFGIKVSEDEVGNVLDSDSDSE